MHRDSRLAMSIFFVVAVLVALPVFARAQESEGSFYTPPPPNAGFLHGLKGMLGEHLGLGATVSYDWVSGDWERPAAAGIVGAWKINDRIMLQGASKYVINSGATDDFRQTVELVMPFYGYGIKK
jgi:hypothetical protein